MNQPALQPRPTAPARGVAHRLLHSRLLNALAYPHGVDRYVELVRPLCVKRDVRAEITAVRRQTPKSVTLTLRPNENWRGLRAGQFVGVSVEIDGVRADPALLSRRLRARGGRRARADRVDPPRGQGLASPARPRAAGDDRRPDAGRGGVRAAATLGPSASC